MNEFYKNFKHGTGDKVWIDYEDTPVQCEITDRHRSSLGARAYLVALPVAEGVPKLQIKRYEYDVFATKEELCSVRIKQCEESIKTYREALAKAEALKSKWEAQCGKKEKEETK